MELYLVVNAFNYVILNEFRDIHNKEVTYIILFYKIILLRAQNFYIY